MIILPKPYMYGGIDSIVELHQCLSKGAFWRADNCFQTKSLVNCMTNSIMKRMDINICSMSFTGIYVVELHR